MEPTILDPKTLDSTHCEHESEHVVKAFSTDIKVGDKDRSVTAKISTVSVDRDGDVLLPQGANFKEFEKNPVVFLGHDYFTLPIGKCTAIKRDDNAIYAKTVFAERPDDYPADKEWVPDTLLSLYKQGVMNGFSVGFVPVEQRPASDADVKKFGAGAKRVFSKWKVLEYSAVALPANQDAVATAVSKGLITTSTAKKLFGVENVKLKIAFSVKPSEASVKAAKDRGQVY